MSSSRDERNDVSHHGVGPRPEPDVLREFSLTLRSGGGSEALTRRFVVKYPGYAEAIHRMARDLASDDEATRVGDSMQPAARDGAGTNDEAATYAEAPTASASKSASVSFTLSRSRAEAIPPVDLPKGAPERLGRFRLLREIGRGGMGLVYLAHDEELGRVVAVKTMRAESADSEVAQLRFRREQEALVGLDHPGIVPVYESGEADGLLYYAMRYVDGRPLDRWMKELGPRPAERSETQRDDIAPLLAAIETVARALHHAHSQGLVHRDVKPANIMIDREGLPLLLDFGLVRHATSETVTRSGGLPGTLPYMAPEAIAGKSVDHRADVYSLGVTLYECLTGRQPFGGPGQHPETIMYAILRKEATSPRKHRPDLPRDIETVVLKCLEKEAQRRYANAEELASELARILAHRRILAEPVGRLGRAWRFVDRNRSITLLGLAAVFAIAMTVGALMHGNNNAGEAAKFFHAGARQEALALMARGASLDLRLDELAAAEKEEIAGEKEAAKRARLIAIHEERRQVEAGRRAAWLAARAASDSAHEWLPKAEDAERSRWLTERLAGQDGGEGLLTLVTEPAGARVIARTYENGPDGRQVLGAERELGQSPLTALSLPVGSYLLRIEAKGMTALDYPVLVRGGEHWGAPDFAGGRFRERDWTLHLRPERSFDADFWVAVPAGPYLATLPERQLGSNPATDWRWQDDYLISRREIAFDALIDLLGVPDLQTILRRDLAQIGDSIFLPIASHGGGRQKHRLRLDDATGALVPGELQPELDLMRWLPACGLSFVAADNIAGFLAQLRSEEISLPTAAEWEKAARGVDGRPYPWGFVFDWSFVAGRRSLEEPLRAGAITLPSGSRPADESPYGCLDLAGNASEWCLDGPGDEGYWIAGGSLADLDPLDFSAWPLRVAAAADRGDFFGLRLVRRGR